MFLRRFDPSTIDPLFLVNRKDDLDWLVGAIADYLRDPSPTARRSLAFCIVGEKGVGKTILTRAALRQVRQDYSDRAIFVEADCRYFHSAMAVIDALAKSVVEGLDDLRSTGTPVSNELMCTAQVLAALTRFGTPQKLSVVSQHLVQFKAAASLKGEQALLKALRLDFQVSVDVSSSTSQQLSGEVTFDEMRLCKALVALCEDIREADIDVVLYIDNMDELAHHYQTPEDRAKVKRDTNTLLLLRDAPIVFAVTMRTYYSGILPRELTNRRKLGRLAPGELLAILERRLEPERAEVKRAVDDSAVKATLAQLAKVAPTPLAFLMWFKAFFEAGALAEDKLDQGVESFLETSYSTVPVEVWRRIVAAFPKPESAIGRAALLAACGGNEAELSQIVDLQGVLPKDFWSSEEHLTLDPLFHIAHSIVCASTRLRSVA
jgi:Cdc6-like AAA superfamily ATPase